MKTLLLFAGLIAVVLALKADVKLTKQPLPLKPSTKEILQQQKVILRLFKNVNEPNLYTDQVKIGETYDIEEQIDSFTNPQAVTEFMDLNRLGFMPKGEIFSIFYQEHRRQAIALFNVLYYAKDFATMYRTACWARLFMNEGMFVYSLSVALVQRPDTAFIDLPPIYEILPYYFYNKDVLKQAQEAREMYEETQMPDVEKPIDQMGSMQKPSMGAPMPKPWMGAPIPTPWMGAPMAKPWMGAPMLKPWMGAPMPKTLMAPPMSKPWMGEPWPLGPTQTPWMGEPWQKPVDDSSSPKPTDPTTDAQMQALIESQQQMAMMFPWFNMISGQLLAQQQLLEQYKQEQLLKEKLKQEKLKATKEGGDEFVGVTIDANYSTWQTDASQDPAVSYFTEDVGLNAFYYYYNIYFPFWLPNDMIYFRTERRGEQFYYMIQQLLARYYLERLSNGLGSIPMLDYTMPLRPGYKPLLGYPNGTKFPERPNNMFVGMQRQMLDLPADSNYTNTYMFVRDYERRIRDAIDVGYITLTNGKQISLYDPNGFEMLGNMMEGNPGSPNLRFYGCLQIFARYLLGNSQYSLDNFKVAPSVLEQFETSLRDPIFYQFYKRMLTYFQRYLNYMPPYSSKDLLMAGVKIQDVQVDDLVTYFDYFYADISSAMKMEKPDEDVEEVPVRVRQMRLNHKPFNFTLGVTSDKPYDAIVKVFLGPKYDEQGRRLEINENRLNFVELDKFQIELTPGINNIERCSCDTFYSEDRASQTEMYTELMTAMNATILPEYQSRAPEWGMPNRLLLPKGTTKGQIYQMYFIISPYKPYKPVKDKSTKKSSDTSKSVEPVQWRTVMDNSPLGYPLDRPVNESVFYVPNSLFKDVMIYNTDMEGTKKMEQ